MMKLLEKFERGIILALMGFMLIAILVATVDVGVILWNRVSDPPIFLLSITEMMEIFGFILMVVIGLELLETLKAYLSRHVIHVEVVLLVAIVAVARKIIILDYKEMSPLMLLAVATLVLTLSGAYYIVKRTLRMPFDGEKPKD